MSAPPSQVPRSDSDLWALYVNKLKDEMTHGQALGDKAAVYVPPMNSQAIPAGNAVHPNITNFAVYNTGDSLLMPNNPLYLPGQASYSERLFKYLNAVQLKTDGDAGPLQVMNTTGAAADKANEDFLAVKTKAFTLYTADPTKGDMSFSTWVSENYPMYLGAKNKMDAAQASYHAAQQNVFGTDATILQNQTKRVGLARDDLAPNAYNMLVSTAMAGTTVIPPPEPTDKSYRALYSIDSSYKETVQNWINTSGDPGKKPVTISFTSNGTDKADWKSSGFTNVDASAKIPFWKFFSVDYSYQGKDNHEEIDLSDSKDNVTCTLKAQDAKSFKIFPGSNWDVPTAKKDYPKLRDSTSPDLLQPMIRITDVLVGYKVSMTMQMSQNLYKKVTDSIDKSRTHDANASVKVFGIDIGFQGRITDSSSTNYDDVKKSDKDFTFEIPASNNTFPILLAIMGEKTA